MTKSISIIIPAYNEESFLEDTVKKDILWAINSLSEPLEDYEILIFDDFSTDKTKEIADGLAKENQRIRVIHNPKNMGFGYNYVKGVELATKDYIILLTGDNEWKKEGIKEMFELAGRADMVISYINNYHVRPFYRQIISRAFTKLINIVFGLKLHYFNGPCILRSDLLRCASMTTFSFAFMAEILVQLIRMGHSYIEVPGSLYIRKLRGITAFRIKNIIGVIKTILSLFWRVYFKDRKKFNQYKKHE